MQGDHLSTSTPSTLSPYCPRYRTTIVLTPFAAATTKWLGGEGASLSDLLLTMMMVHVLCSIIVYPCVGLEEEVIHPTNLHSLSSESLIYVIRKNICCYLLDLNRSSI